MTNSEPHRREGACRDGLAGLDINDAGVVVIDDLRDVENMSSDQAANGDDDFEEVISKKSKRIRQQQINEQLEAVTFFFFFFVYVFKWLFNTDYATGTS